MNPDAGRVKDLKIPDLAPDKFMAIETIRKFRLLRHVYCRRDKQPDAPHGCRAWGIINTKIRRRNERISTEKGLGRAHCSYQPRGDIMQSRLGKMHDLFAVKRQDRSSGQ